MRLVVQLQQLGQVQALNMGGQAINNTGVCSSFNQVDLWRCSVESGSNQSFDEFRGYAQRPSPIVPDEEKKAGSGGGVTAI